MMKSLRSIILPSVWYINHGCDSKLALHPYDADGDRVECVLTSNQKVQHFQHFSWTNPAFQLDQLECIVYYIAVLDDSTHEKSLISLQIQDYDANETDYISSVPVQFTTHVLKPVKSLRRSSDDFCSRRGKIFLVLEHF